MEPPTGDLRISFGTCLQAGCRQAGVPSDFYLHEQQARTFGPGSGDPEYHDNRKLWDLSRELIRTIKLMFTANPIFPTNDDVSDEAILTLTCLNVF